VSERKVVDQYPRPPVTAEPGSLRWQMQDDILEFVNGVLGVDFCHPEWELADYLIREGWVKKEVQDNT